MTSAVTLMPRALAQRMISTEPAVETWQTCSRESDVLGEQHVAGDDAFLGDGGPAGEAEDGGDLALVHLRAGGEPRFLRVLGHHAVERLDVFQRAAHQDGIVDADAVVGEDPDPGAGVGHGAELGQLLPRQADGDGADRADVHPAGGAAQA